MTIAAQSRVLRAGFAAVKGARHRALSEVRLDPYGPVGDREWCLVDPARARVLRTSSHPLLDVESEWDGRTLSLVLPDGREVAEEPVPTGEPLLVDYWGRRVSVVPHHGAVGEVLARRVGRQAILCRAARGDIVYGASVTLLGSASLADLAARADAPRVLAESERFRATFLVDTSRPGEEDEWLGSVVGLGDAEVRVTGRVGRCAVPNRHPATGAADLSLLKLLATYRPANDAGEPCFGVEAEVVTPAVVHVGDRCRQPGAPSGK